MATDRDLRPLQSGGPSGAVIFAGEGRPSRRTAYPMLLSAADSQQNPREVSTTKPGTSGPAT
jgi:hypothetical protein